MRNYETEDSVCKRISGIIGIDFGQRTKFKTLGFNDYDVKRIQESIKKTYNLETALLKAPDGWFFDEDTNFPAIVFEAKNGNENIDSNEVLKQIKSYMYIAATKYKKVIGIVSNGIKSKTFKFLRDEIIEVDDARDKIHNKDYYFNLYANNKKVDKEQIYNCTYKLNEIFYKKIKIKSLIQRMIFTASMLIARKNGAEFPFDSDFDDWKQIISTKLKNRIEKDLEKNDKYNHKVSTLYNHFQTIEPIIDENKNHDILKTKKEILYSIDKIVFQMDSPNWNGEDVMSIFFNEFSRYKGEIRNGQVFTPEHIASLMYKLSGIDKNSNVLDACCGSGSFLVKSMAYMIDEAGGDITTDAINIKQKQLFGIENDPEIFSLACANMLLHKDGKTNLRLADAKSKEMSDWIKSNKINKVLMNPPYEDELGCLDIVYNVLNSVEKNADCLFLMPNNKLSKHFNKNTKLTNRILEKHKLIRIIKLPNIFQGLAGAGEVSIFQFKAHNQQNNSKCVGYHIVDDGFETVKNKGRQDVKGIWSSKEGLENKWFEIIDNYLEDASKILMDVSKGEVEYKKQIELKVSEDDFLRVIIDRYMFENPDVASLFNLKGKK